MFKEIVDAYDWSFCQIQLNYIDNEYQAGLKGLKYASDKELGVVIMDQLRGGGLASNIPEEIVNRFCEVNLEHEPVEWAFK
ncbi:MAG: hypothetical protein N4A76_04065 [Firmicutes bacterium]|nr:hypothetical protein [Bacillota bacterium]